MIKRRLVSRAVTAAASYFDECLARHSMRVRVLTRCCRASPSLHVGPGELVGALAEEDEVPQERAKLNT